MNKQEYKKYLESDSWKNLRMLAFKRANNKCELCGERATECHHIKYPKNLSDDKLDNLLVCCKKCHQKQHGIRDGGEKLLRKTINQRIEKLDDWKSSDDYHGFNMTGNRDCGGIESCREENWELFKRFLDYMPEKFSLNSFKLFAWKGAVWWGDEDSLSRIHSNQEKDFSGWTTEDIIFWIIRNKGRYARVENTEAFEKDIRRIELSYEKEVKKDGVKDGGRFK